MTYQQALIQVLTYGQDIQSAFSVIASQQNNNMLPLRATKQHLTDVLNRVLCGELNDDDIELWATVVDNQAAIDSSEIEDYLFAITNHDMMGDMCKNTIEKMLKLLET